MRFSPGSGRCPLVLFGLAVLMTAGCGPSTGRLTGKVTYQGNALKGGNVTLVPEGSGMSFSTPIQEDGTYTFEQVRSGKYKVCVETNSLKPSSRPSGPTYPGVGGSRGKAQFKNEPPKGAVLPEGYKMDDPFAREAANAKRYVAIPDKYAQPESTTLTVEVKGGPQQHDIPLT